MPFFFTDDSFISEGTSNLAEKFRTIGDDILDAGHTVEKHVAQTNQDLIKRAFQEGVDASSFTNQRTAIDAVKEALRKNTDDIAAWLANPESGKKAFTTLHNNPIGKGVQAGKNTVVEGITQSTIVLVKDATQEFGFKVLTAFPKVQ